MEKPLNKMVEKLKKDQMVVSAKLNITSHIPATLAAIAGYDAIWLDMEHIPTDWNEVNECVLAAKAYGIESVVRVARGAYSNMTRPLEMDASAVMVPHVMNKEDAEWVARMTKFYPIGRRPIDGGYTDGQYCRMDYAKYIEYSNSERLTIIQIEDIEALEDIENIAQVPGIDMLFFGPADFAHSIGIPTEMGDPRVTEARRKVAAVARKYGKYAGTVGSPANIRELYDMGYRYVNITADVALLGRAFLNNYADYKKAMEGIIE